MPFVTVDNTRLYYRMEGRADAPVLMLSHSLGCDHGMWNLQAPQLVDHFRVLRYDTRGHGASEAPPGDYTVERLGRDALGIADALGIERFAFCGLSLGGITGQWMAAHVPERITKLVLANTSAKFPDPSVMETRYRTVLAQGMAPILDSVMQRFFTSESLAAGSPHVDSTRATLLATDPRGYAGCCAAVRDLDNRALLERIAAPTLVIVGEKDVSTPWAGHGEVLASRIAGARVARFPTAHLSNIERPRSFTWVLLDFLTEPRDATAMRRSVLGDAHVERALSAATDLNRDFQELITRFAWGAVWSRPGLEARTRRLLVLATTAAMGRWEEFRLHIRTGLEHELELCDLKEVLLQVAVYAGVPAANTGFQIAAEEISKGDAPAG